MIVLPLALSVSNQCEKSFDLLIRFVDMHSGRELVSFLIFSNLLLKRSPDTPRLELVGDIGDQQIDRNTVLNSTRNDNVCPLSTLPTISQLQKKEEQT